ncbi:hypothetical protein DB346_22540 [Verrucomicrobia bacterium LW23]|nr:hypothetical protein DB346_22540 [Verrucomicrobia bacterium LW23]
MARQPLQPDSGILWRRRVASAVAAALACVAVALLHALASSKGAALGWLRPLQIGEHAFQDLRCRTGTTAPANPHLIFLAVDEPSIRLSLLSDEEKQQPPFDQMAAGWPWPRSVYAAVLDRLCNAGARMVVFDFLFSTPGKGDEEFRQAMERWPGRVLLACNLEQSRGTQSQTGQFPSPTLLPGDAGAADPRLGCITFFPDEADFCVRSAVFRTDLMMGDLVPESLAARVVRAAGPAGSEAFIPKTARPQLIRFTGPPSLAGLEKAAFRPHSLHEIFLPSFWERNYQGGKVFQDAIVLVGPDGNMLKDIIPTPLGPMPGPELHLNAVNALWHNDFLHEPPLSADIASIVLLAAAAWVLTCVNTSRIASLAALLAVGMGWIALGHVLYDVAALQVVTLAPLLALAIAWMAAQVTDYTLDAMYFRQMRGMLERYVSKRVASDLLDNPNSVLRTLGGERRPVVVLFTDLRGFTSLSEAIDPVEMVDRLNEYFALMVRPVLAEGGTLDKFIGDALMAVWGNFITAGARQDAAAAVRAGLAMRRALEELNVKWTHEHKDKSGKIFQLKMGIGIHSGDAVVGNLGCEEKMDPTVIGDTVNLASRVEGLTKQYHVDFLISDSVAAQTEGYFRLQSVDRVQPVGRAQPVQVFHVICLATEPVPGGEAAQRYLAAYEEAYSHAVARRFAAASIGFAEALKHRPDDYLATLHHKRCTDALADANHHAWSGFAVMESK